MSACAICGDDLPTLAHEYGEAVNGPVVCFNDWMIYLDWQQTVTAVAERVFADFTQRGGDEVAAQVLTLAGYLTFVEPDDVEAAVLDEYDLLPAHVPAGVDA